MAMIRRQHRKERLFNGPFGGLQQVLEYLRRCTRRVPVMAYSSGHSRLPLCDAEKIDATFKDGVLTVNLPRRR
jgi:hypothetical protein